MTPRAASVLAVIAVLGLVEQAAAQPSDTEAGRLLYNNACRTCHTLREGDNRLGPHLRGVVGRQAGSVAGYAYSSALARGDLVWDRATLDRFIANPDAVAPGHGMRPYTGIASAAERAKLIAFLEATAGN
jgi:cytochrome c